MRLQPKPVAVAEAPQFSLMRGGLLFGVLRRLRLSGDSLDFARRRVLVIVAVAWLPLLFLTAVDGTLAGSGVAISFLRDVEAQARLLVALPLLLIAETIADDRVSPTVRRFVERRIVGVEDLPAFNAAVRSTSRLCGSIVLEAGLLVLVYTAGRWLWRGGMATAPSVWYKRAGSGGLELTPAGDWYVLVSIPLFQFMLLRWYLRMALWARLLWRISRLRLHLTVAHPDRVGGIGFLKIAAYGFWPVLFAQGALASGLIGGRVLYGGETLASFAVTAGSALALMVLFVLGPLLLFTPQLDRARRTGTGEYGLLANQIVFAFEQKWLRGGRADVDPAASQGDFQALADLAQGYQPIGEMRLVPFDMTDVARLAAATAAPLLPLALTMFSLPELAVRVAKFLL